MWDSSSTAWTGRFDCVSRAQSERRRTLFGAGAFAALRPTALCCGRGERESELTSSPLTAEKLGELLPLVVDLGALLLRQPPQRRDCQVAFGAYVPRRSDESVDQHRRGDVAVLLDHGAAELLRQDPRALGRRVREQCGVPL